MGVSPGDSCTLQKEITQEMVEAFAALSGDYNPVHMDEDYCLGHGLGSRIVHGMLELSFVSALIGMRLPGEGTVWLSQSFDFIAPARVGDMLTVTGRVVEVNSNNMLGLNIIKMAVTIKNQKNATLVRGSVRVSLK